MVGGGTVFVCSVLVCGVLIRSFPDSNDAANKDDLPAMLDYHRQNSSICFTLSESPDNAADSNTYAAIVATVRLPALGSRRPAAVPSPR